MIAKSPTLYPASCDKRSCLRTGLETLAFGCVLLLHFVLAARIISVNTLHLGGDTTREAWHALLWLSSGHLNHEFSAVYESDVYCFLFLPFLAVFKNTILALKAAGVWFTVTTVAVFYAYVRRVYGLPAAFFSGLVCAASPLLLAHGTLVTEFSIILWLAVMLLTGTVVSPYTVYLQAFLAGFFTCLHPYFLLPFTAYLLSRINKHALRGLTSCPAKKIAYGLALFVIGLSPLVYKVCLSLFHHHAGTVQFWEVFFQTNASRWSDIPALLMNVWTQFSWSLDAFIIYHPVSAPPLLNTVVLLWLLIIIAALKYGESRRWAAALAAGLLFAGFIASPKGLGLRHLLLFLPFCWLLLAARISRASKPGRYALGAAAVLITLHYVYLDNSFAARNAGADGISQNVEYLRQFAAQSPRPAVLIYSDDTNLFFDMKYLVPHKDVQLFPPLNSPRRRCATVVLCKSPQSPDRPRQTDTTYIDLGTSLVSGRTLCRVLYEK